MTHETKPMDGIQRAERRAQERRALENLAAASPILQVTPHGDPPQRFELRFAGRGVGHVGAITRDIEWLDDHHCEIVLPAQYPDVPPDVRWTTPLFHPNVSYSGLLRLEDIGLPWSPELGLEIVCQRLWDVARLAFVDLERAVNLAARRWLDEESSLRLPIDTRPLREVAPPDGPNIIRYRRRGPTQHWELEGPVPAVPHREVMFIGDETAQLETAPRARESGQREHMPRDAGVEPRPAPRAATGDDDILYIGED